MREGRGHKSQNKRRAEAGGEALSEPARVEGGFFSLHTSKPLNARRPRPGAGSCLLLSRQLQGPQHEGARLEQVNAICPALTRCPALCLLLPAGRGDFGEVRPASYPLSAHSSMFSPAFFMLPGGLQAQSLPGIYHRGGPLLKNTWSPFTEISKGIESMEVFSGGGGLVCRVGYPQENRAQ